MGDLLGILDLNNLLLKYVNPILNGIENIGQDLIIAATLIAAIEIVILAIRSRENAINFMGVFFERLIKFSVLLVIIKNFRTIIDTSLRLFIEIGVAFGGDKSYIQGNNTFNFNYIWGQIGEIIAYIIKVTSEFKGQVGIFYGIIIIIMVILSSVILVAMFSAVLTYYFVSVFTILTLPMNLFTPVMDLSKQVIKAWIISGLMITIFTAIMRTTVYVLKVESERVQGIGIKVGNNDVIAVLMFILLLGLITAIYLSVNDISNFILKGHGQGFSFNRLGGLVQSGVNTALNLGLLALAVYTGGTTAAAAGANSAAQAGKAAAEAEKTRRTFSDLKNARRAARAGGSAINKGVATATDSETKENKGSTAERVDNLKTAKDIFKKGKDGKS
jgi:hypothetical protein